MSEVKIGFLHENEIEVVSMDLESHGIYRNAEYLEDCIRQVEEGKRVIFLAKTEEKTVGMSHLLLTSRHPELRSENIPEINDLIVGPDQRGRGIGAKLLAAQEEYAKEQGFQSIGLCVGLYSDYGPAQRLYLQRGHIPDGRGVVYDYRMVEPGEMVRLDDELTLCLIKCLK